VALSMQGNSWQLFFNTHALVLVLGGTLTILIMSTPGQALRNLLSAIRAIFKRKSKIDDFRGDLETLIQARTLPRKSSNKLINYAAELWEQGIDPDLFIVLLSQRRDDLERGYL